MRLEPPAPRLRAGLVRDTGVDVGDEAAERASPRRSPSTWTTTCAAATPAGLEALRDECAAVLHEALGADGLERDAVREAMLGALVVHRLPRRRAGAGGAPRRRGARGGGEQLGLLAGEALARAGLGGLIDGAVSSAEVGRAKPEPAAFRAGLALAGVEADDALFVGDSPETDIAGARAAGIRALLIARDGEPRTASECGHVAGARALPTLKRRWRPGPSRRAAGSARAAGGRRAQAALAGDRSRSSGFLVGLSSTLVVGTMLAAIGGLRRRGRRHERDRGRHARAGLLLRRHRVVLRQPRRQAAAVALRPPGRAASGAPSAGRARHPDLLRLRAGLLRAGPARRRAEDRARSSAATRARSG